MTKAKEKTKPLAKKAHKIPVMVDHIIPPGINKADVVARLVQNGVPFDEAETMVNGQPDRSWARKPEMSDKDGFTKSVPVDFKPRAGVSSYADELAERLQDVKDRKERVFYLLPLRLPKKLYAALLSSALEEALSDPDREWTEQDEIHKLLKINEAMRLAAVAPQPADKGA